MALTVRTADKVAQSLIRSLPADTGNNAAPSSLTDPTLAHGAIGTDNCILTVGVRNAVSGNTTITCWWWSGAMKEWLKAGANIGVYQKVYEPGTADAFTLPEQSFYYLQTSQVLTAGQLWTDGTNARGMPIS